MLRQLLTDIKAQVASVIQNGKIQVQGTSSGSSGGGTSAADFAVATNISIPDASLTDVGTIDVSGVSFLGIQIENTGSYPLTAFAVDVKANSTANWIPLFDQASDYTAPAFGSPLKGASSDLTNLEGGTEGWINLDVSFYSRVRLRAGSASSTSVTVSAGGK